MAGRIRSKADDWGGQSQPRKVSTMTRRTDFAPVELPPIPEAKSVGPRNPMYQTSNSKYGVNTDRVAAHPAEFGKQGRFTKEYITPCKPSGFNTALDRSRVGPTPQFGRDPYDVGIL
eukprot:NODE_2512_length_523_cov_22.542194_g1995_i0.p2 GENE.NODE_2512_length_523_cov_22.542194_g1995_i0~~NODE_2512_length_523_cov_22.542194_g1995_i0.p2  ORF type:complete len:135 (+),score=30.23 NODE_2512_length_523_cov_22.542194_g1995_i0:56-406(+)